MKNAMCFVVPEVLAISPIRKKKAQNVKRNIALKGSEKMCSKAIFKLFLVIESLDYDDGFTFWNPCNICL